MATLALRNPPATTALTEDQFTSQWDYPAASSAALTERKEQEFTFSAQASTYRVVVRDSTSSASTKVLPAWVEPTISAFVGIQKLSENWDSYGGKRINRDSINQSLRTLAMIMKTDSPAPSVVPLGDGGIQIEWHRRQQDLEIVFSADEAPQFYYQNRATGKLDEGSADEIGKLIGLLRNLA
ncbi:MAG: hypothetical protein WCE63_06045 [Acidobacteriaceae bacterium]